VSGSLRVFRSENVNVDCAAGDRTGYAIDATKCKRSKNLKYVLTFVETLGCPFIETALDDLDARMIAENMFGLVNDDGAAGMHVMRQCRRCDAKGREGFMAQMPKLF